MANQANSQNNNFKPEFLDAIWDKADASTSSRPGVFRKDVAGAWIKRDDYGKQNSEYGWEVDHIKPVAKGGETELYNLRPLQHQNNAAKGDHYPIWTAVVTAGDNGRNRECSKSFLESL